MAVELIYWDSECSCWFQEERAKSSYASTIGRAEQGDVLILTSPTR